MRTALSPSLRAIAMAGGVGSLLSGCTTGQVGVPPQVTTSVTSSFVLKFAVGTATMPKPGGGSVVGLNVAATFRQANAQNATATNTPTLSGPASFNGVHSITGITPAQLSAGAANIAAGILYKPAPNQIFGAIMGVFGDGFDQLNLIDTETFAQAFPGNVGAFGLDACASSINDGTGGGTGTTGSNGQTPGFENTPVPIDVLAPCANSPAVPKRIAYYGGPPAWPSPQGYGIPSGFIGYPLGFLDFDDVAPVVGSYHLDVAYSTNGTATTYAHVGANANLSRTAPLGAFLTPVVSPQSDGSALVTVDVPPGVTEAVVLVNDDSCQLNSSGLATQRFFSLLTRQVGPQTLLLSSKLGPPDASGNPTDTFCTAADDALPNASSNHALFVSAVGFDYPAFEASYPQSTTPAPVISAASGQADVTTSAQISTRYKLATP